MYSAVCTQEKTSNACDDKKTKAAARIAAYRQAVSKRRSLHKGDVIVGHNHDGAILQKNGFELANEIAGRHLVRGRVSAGDQNLLYALRWARHHKH